MRYFKKTKKIICEETLFVDNAQNFTDSDAMQSWKQELLRLLLLPFHQALQ